ncbi:hypothetical protein CEXT_219601 [Caerostris extrusa]|uniref:Uncharacterized protein n=1 Tax=Caerostris extrusa TaxID=172846 RepID=A0AAV4VGK3_CAEEX|nr:hypothetical protein CEXT_219601 [Caerostris extrusa]
MPGVTHAEKWTSRESRISDFGTFSSEMTPQKRFDGKSSTGSQYSNGYNTDPSSDSGEHYPTYLLEHLATFSVGSQFGISSPKDGLRRLLQMEKSSGIWTQRMQMRLERKWVVIIDNENGIRSGALSYEPDQRTHILHQQRPPRALQQHRRFHREGRAPQPAKMHIFQCARVSAQEVVNEMKMFINGKWKPSPKENGRHLPPPPESSPDPPVNGVNVREAVSLFNAVVAAAASPPKGDGMIQRVSSGSYHPSKMEGHRLERDASFGRDSNDETSSTSSEKYERDVAILNHCFDDIERFIARLQHAAAAFKELERRQKSRKSKKKDMGDGMLSIPPKRNSWTSCRNSSSPSISWEHWESFEGTYHPVFSDGWAPENPFSEDRAKREEGQRVHEEVDVRHQDFRVSSRQDRYGGGSDYYHSEAKERPVSPMLSSEPPHMSFESRYYDNAPADLPRRHFDRNGAVTPVSELQDVRSDFSADSIDHGAPSEPQLHFERHQKQFLEDLVAKGAHVVQVMYPRTANNDKELTVLRGRVPGGVGRQPQVVEGQELPRPGGARAAHHRGQTGRGGFLPQPHLRHPPQGPLLLPSQRGQCDDEARERERPQGAQLPPSARHPHQPRPRGLGATRAPGQER